MAAVNVGGGAVFGPASGRRDRGMVDPRLDVDERVRTVAFG
ncbi:hypothetical protein ACWEOE_31075 [Amycolatopsis sp. NPDC004368]